MSITMWIITIVVCMLAAVGALVFYWVKVAHRTTSGEADTRLERIKNIAEIAILGVGAGLAAVKFFALDRPAMVPQVEFDSEMESVYYEATGACITEFVVSVKNTSRTALPVDSARSVLIRVPVPARTAQIVQQKNFGSVPADAPWLSSPKGSGLAFDYPPGVEYKDAFLWTHAQTPDSSCSHG